jgi:transcription initiation factor TFIIH subunit 1
VYEDLDTKFDVRSNTGPPLILTQVDRYLHGPVPNVENNHDSSVEHVKMIASQLMKETNKWSHTAYLSRQPSTSLVSPAASVSALGELTPGGSLMKGFREDSLGRECFVVTLLHKILENRYNILLIHNYAFDFLQN